MGNDLESLTKYFQLIALDQSQQIAVQQFYQKMKLIMGTNGDEIG